MTNKHHLFTGRSGQLALMAEFLIRDLNVAMPEVDVGDDIVVVRDDTDEISRVQVKTANAVELKTAGHFTAQFKLPLEQLELGPVHLVYAFVVRREQRWEEFLIVRRSILFHLHTAYSLGSRDGEGNLIVPFTFQPDAVRNKTLNLHAFRYRFTPWPPPNDIPVGVVPE